MNFGSKRSVSEEEEFECKWDYFRKLKDLSDDEIHENDANIRKYINDIDNTESSLLSDEMNAMERTLKLSELRDIISENIVCKISDPKEKMLVTLLYKVCNDIDPTRMQFIRFCVALKNHGILNNLNFLTNPLQLPLKQTHKHTHEKHEQHEHEEQWSDNDNDNDKDNDNDNDLSLIRLMSNDINNNSNNNNNNNNNNENICDDNNFQNNMISRYYRDFEEIECIGYGAFGTVHKVKHKLDLSIYAIKKIIYKHDSINHENIKNQIIREIKNIAQLNHQNVVRYYTAWIENGPIIINNKKNNNNNENNEMKNDNNNNNNNVMSFFDYKIENETNNNNNNKNNRLNPSGSIPILRTKSNEGLSLLLSSDATQSLISPYSSQQTSPNPNINNRRERERQKDKKIVHYWKNQTAYSCLFLQTEYCGKYTLYDFINDPNRIPDVDNNMHILSQILLGLAHIHSKLLLHRDIKPENIFLIPNKNTLNSNQFTVKIGDFGLSKSLKFEMNEFNNSFTPNMEYNYNNNFTNDIGTNTYASPEQLIGNKYDTSCDIYSLGIILFELIQYPFTTMMERRISISKFRNNNFIDFKRINQQKFINEIDLILQMTNNKPSLRPSAYSLILNENIQRYWMENILNNAMPHFKQIMHSNESSNSTQKSLEYNQNINDNIEISFNNNKKQNDSPTFLLSSPKTNELFHMELENSSF